jgi:hypothetical protein
MSDPVKPAANQTDAAKQQEAERQKREHERQEAAKRQEQAKKDAEKRRAERASARPEGEAVPVIAPFGSRLADPMEQMFLDGRAIDSNLQPIGKMDPADPRVNLVRPVPLDAAEQESLKGELKPGEQGWIELDEVGSPTGQATNVPPINKPAAPVSVVIVAPPVVLSTPAGAYLTEAGMNPSPQVYKYSSPAYNRNYEGIAEQVAERDSLIIPEAKSAA